MAEALKTVQNADEDPSPSTPSTADTAVPSSELFVCPILHPSYILRGKWNLEPFQNLYISSAWNLAHQGKFLDTSKKRDKANINPSIGDLLRFFNGISNRRNEDDRVVTVDIECAGEHLTKVGFCDVLTLESVIMTFRLKRGVLPDCTPSELKLRIEILYDALVNDRILKVFHNGASFDLNVLEDIGFVINGYIFDTMIGWFTAWPETPKRLEFVAGVFGVPKWKHLVEEEDDIAK